MIQSLDLTYYVVIQLQLLKTVQALQVVDFNNIFVRQRQMSELPERSVVFSENLVFTVILN